LAAIGEAAGWVGHDIRNPLQAMVSELYLSKDEIKDMPASKNKQSLEESIRFFEENLFYINKIVSDLQDYSRPLKAVYVEVNLYELVADALFSMVIPGNLTAFIKVEDNFRFKTDSTFLKRILGNLIINAVQAMPNGGKLTIEASKKNGGVVIVVEDTGVGIAEEVKPRLFSPMFTTKAKGMGLGLSAAKRLVETLNGTISFESQVGKGTKFTINLPVKQN
jgi:two-component system NtrC family sensor kinase